MRGLQAGLASLLVLGAIGAQGARPSDASEGRTHAAAGCGSVAYVTNIIDGTVTPITVATNTPGMPIPVGNFPFGVAFSPDGTVAYVTNDNDNTVTPITVAINAPGTPIPVGHGPYAVAFSPDGTVAYVVNIQTPGTVTPITVATNTPGTPIPVGLAPEGVAFSPDGTVAYVVNYESFHSEVGTVTPITVATNTPGTPIPVGNFPVGVAFSPDGTVAYVTNSNGNLGVGTVTPITVATNTPGTPIPVGTGPAGVAFSPDGTVAYVTHDTSPSTVTPITVATNTPGTPIPVGNNPSGVAFSPDGTVAYVTNYNDNTVTPITVATNTPGTPIPVGHGPFGVAFPSCRSAPPRPPGPTSPPPRPGSLCRDSVPLVIGVRGSGEKLGAGSPASFGKLLSAVWNRVAGAGNVLGYGLPYAAQAVGLAHLAVDAGALVGDRGAAYYESVDGGVGMLTYRLQQTLRECPNAGIVLLGYSQGAHVIGDTIVNGRLGAVLGAHIKAVVMFGDPKFNSQLSIDRGTYSGNNGMLKARPPQELSVYADRTLDICRHFDPVCQLTVLNVLDPSQHDANAYTNDGYDVQAANFIRSKLGSGISATSTTSTASVGAMDALALPPSPSGVQVQPGVDTVTLSWDPPPAPPSGGYACYLISSDQPDQPQVVQVGGNATSCVFSPLDATRSYQGEVLDSDGTTWSVPATAGPVQPLLNPSNTAPTAALSATVTDADANWVVLDGSGSTDADGWFAGVHFDFGDGTTSDGQGLAATTQGHSYPHAGTYHVVLTLKDNDGETAMASTEVSVVSGKPNPPSGVSGTPGSGQATVNWTPPSVDGGSAVLAYAVTASPGGASAFVAGANGSAPPTQAAVAGLEGGTPYTFTVVATNAVGDSPPSTPSNAVVPSVVVHRRTPRVPNDLSSGRRRTLTHVMATAGSARATVSFSPPADRGGDESYRATASPGGATAVGTGSPITVVGLTNGTAYSFTVTATATGRADSASPPSNTVVPTAANDSSTRSSPLAKPSTRGKSDTSHWPWLLLGALAPLLALVVLFATRVPIHRRA